MRPQKVSVDVWKMVISSCSYLGLAFLAWVFLKLVYACFRFPGYLKENQRLLETASANKIQFNNGPTESEIKDKKSA